MGNADHSKGPQVEPFYGFRATLKSKTMKNWSSGMRFSWERGEGSTKILYLSISTSLVNDDYVMIRMYLCRHGTTSKQITILSSHPYMWKNKY